MIKNGINSFSMKFELENGRVVEATGKYDSSENSMDMKFSENGVAPAELEEETVKELYKLFNVIAGGFKQALDEDLQHGPEDSLILDGGEF